MDATMEPGPTEDREIIELMQRGDQAGLAALIHKHGYEAKLALQREFGGFALARDSSRFSEAIADAALAMFERSSFLNARRSLRGELVRFAEFQMRKSLEELAADSDAAAFLKFAESLTATERAIFDLDRRSGGTMSAAEIARRLRIGVGSVYVLRHRIRLRRRG